MADFLVVCNDMGIRHATIDLIRTMDGFYADGASYGRALDVIKDGEYSGHILEVTALLPDSLDRCLALTSQLKKRELERVVVHAEHGTIASAVRRSGLAAFIRGESARPFLDYLRQLAENHSST